MRKSPRQLHIRSTKTDSPVLNLARYGISETCYFHSTRARHHRVSRAPALPSLWYYEILLWAWSLNLQCQAGSKMMAPLAPFRLVACWNDRLVGAANAAFPRHKLHSSRHSKSRVFRCVSPCLHGSSMLISPSRQYREHVEISPSHLYLLRRAENVAVRNTIASPVQLQYSVLYYCKLKFDYTSSH
jgi:hypothetical protein